MKRILLGTILIFSFAVAVRAEAAGASLYFSSAGDSFGAGETFLVDIKMDTGGRAINAAEISVEFPSNKLRAVSVSKENSIFTLWPQEPAFSNEQGKLSFVGGVP